MDTSMNGNDYPCEALTVGLVDFLKIGKSDKY